MSVTSFYFLVFLILGAFVYYLVPGKAQWIVLLVMSVGFYITATTPYTIFFLAFSTLVAYFSTLFIEKNRDRPGKTKAISMVAITAIFLNVIIWFLLKGSSFWILSSKLVQKVFPSFPVLGALPLLPALGMGYYTAQVIGYILDVHWRNASAQKNPLKLFLFVSFFPQLTVGPISRYGDLKILYSPHKLVGKNISFGAQRVLWGFFKKLVVADRIAVIVNNIWTDTARFGGVFPWLAVLLYPIEIYADFSGCMDIVLGSAELFDIHLAENFRNPFFSRNTQEFWQRWHITLGGWARDYVFYPFMKSRHMISFGKKCKKRFGKKAGKFIAWSVSMAVLWFVMGFWHGSIQHIFGVSLWFWTAMFLSELCQPLTSKLTTFLEVKTESFGWHLFQSIRTYIIYALGVVFFTSQGLKSAFSHYEILIRSFFHPTLSVDFGSVLSGLGISWRDVNLILIGMICILVAGVLREKYSYAREWIRKQSVWLRWLIWIFLIFVVLIYGMYGPGYDASTFIYQGF